MKYKFYRNLARHSVNTAGIVVIVILALVFCKQSGYFFRPSGPSGPIAGSRCEIVKSFPFSEPDSLKEWEVKIFKKKGSYSVVREGQESFVRAISDNAASAMYYKVAMDAKARRPVVSWRWRVDKFPAKSAVESLEVENVDDFAARVYVIFPAMFITNSRVLEYVWSETLPVGTTGTSPYSKNIKLIVLEQGVKKPGEWLSEERDIQADYRKMFGRAPEYNIGAVAFMTNTEHTGTSAGASYDDIVLSYNDAAAKK